jgi:hypothetical protein
MGWPSRAPRSATQGCAATTRCWPLAPAPATCRTPGCAAVTPTPPAGRPASSPRRSTGSVPPAPPGRSACGPTRASTPTRWSRSASRPGCAPRSPPSATRGSPRRSSRSRRRLGADRLLAGGRGGCGRDQLPPVRQARTCGAAARGPGAPTPGSQLALDVIFDYHRFITDRDGATLELEADHRRHAESNPRSATSSTAWALRICPRVGSPPTPPGWGWSASPTTWPAGPGGSGWASRRSRPRPAHPFPGHPGPADAAPARPLAVALALPVRTRRPALHRLPDLTTATRRCATGPRGRPQRAHRSPSGAGTPEPGRLAVQQAPLSRCSHGPPQPDRPLQVKIARWKQVIGGIGLTHKGAAGTEHFPR